MSHEKPVQTVCPVLELLLQRAAKNGHSQVQLAKAIGVSYQRLRQYRRGEAGLANALPSTLKKVSIYLDMPVVLLMVLAGRLGIQDMEWPGDVQRGRLQQALLAMRHDPWVGPLMPAELEQGPASVQQFVLWLWGQYTVACNTAAGNAYPMRWTDILAVLAVRESTG